MLAAMVCREFKWTWQEYQDQPQVFIDTIVDMMVAEGRENEARQKKNERKRP